MATTIINESLFSNCQNGQDRYNALRNAHQNAYNSGNSVEYASNLYVEIEIPNNATPIELSNKTNFNGSTIVVKNISHNFTLFKISRITSNISVTKAFIDNLIGATIPTQLSTGNKMLIIEDQTPWTIRSGYNENVMRKDIIILKGGKHLNMTIAPYSTTASNPSCSYVEIDTDTKIFENLHFVRDGGSTHITFLLSVENICYLNISNINIITHFAEGVPEDGYETDIEGSFLTKGDSIIKIEDSAYINFSNVFISGTYSSDVTYGYGIEEVNVYHNTFSRLFSKTKWGVFGNKFLNEVFLNDCDINRFDILCYGANIHFHKCTFRNPLSSNNNYNQFSSIYGKILYDNCFFYHFLPLLLEESYNAYTGFDLVIHDGTIIVGNRRQIVFSYYFNNVINSRLELSQKCLPNVTIKGMTIIIPSSVTDFSVYGFVNAPTYQSSIGYLSKLILENVSFIKENPNGTFMLSDSNYNITIENSLERNVPSTMVTNIYSE